MPPQRSSGHPSEGSDPRDLWREYADEAGIPGDEEWSEDLDIDPLDSRPLPRRRRRRRGAWVARALAWTGGAALLMIAGGVLALAMWPRSPGPATSVAATPVAPDSATAPAETIPHGTPAARVPEDAEARETAAVAEERDEPGAAGPAAAPVEAETRLAPPPLPPLPPGLEPAPSSSASPSAPAPSAPAPGDAPGPVQARVSPPPDVPPSASAGTIARPPTPLPARDTRSSAEIMADFLVSSGDKAQAEATARTYAEWYAAGTAEHTYWLGVLREIRSRP